MLAESGPTLGDIMQAGSNLGQIWPDSGRDQLRCENSTDFGQNWRGIGQIGPFGGNLNAILAEELPRLRSGFAPKAPTSGQIWPRLGGSWTTSAEVDPTFGKMLAGTGHIRPNSGLVWSKLRQHRLCQIWPTQSPILPTPHRLWPNETTGVDRPIEPLELVARVAMSARSSLAHTLSNVGRTSGHLRLCAEVGPSAAPERRATWTLSPPAPRRFRGDDAASKSGRNIHNVVYFPVEKTLTYFIRQLVMSTV